MAVQDASSYPMISEAARNRTVYDCHGDAITFGKMLDTQQKSTNRLLLIFVRHFFCGNCQEYVRRLSTDLQPSALPSDLSIVIMGCGAASLISSYIEVTNCRFPIYSDPTADLYKILGMHRSLSLGKKGPAYIRHSLASGMVKSIYQGIKRIPSGDVMQAGDLDVNGGEFLLERLEPFVDSNESSWNISWSHRMMNSRDHTEVADLKCLVEGDCASASDALSGSGSSI